MATHVGVVSSPGASILRPTLLGFEGNLQPLERVMEVLFIAPFSKASSWSRCG